MGEIFRNILFKKNVLLFSTAICSKSKQGAQFDGKIILKIKSEARGLRSNSQATSPG
jgi:hypothetical protein